MSTTWVDRVVSLTLVWVPADLWLARGGFLVIEQVHDGTIVTCYSAGSNRHSIEEMSGDSLEYVFVSSTRGRPPPLAVSTSFPVLPLAAGRAPSAHPDPASPQCSSPRGPSLSCQWGRVVGCDQGTLLNERCW
eukprot:COSAG02_NODE_5891_length_3957_cov_2.013738_2_plen_133_part_00